MWPKYSLSSHAKKLKKMEMEVKRNMGKASGRWHGMEKNCCVRGIINVEGPNNRGMNGNSNFLIDTKSMVK